MDIPAQLRKLLESARIKHFPRGQIVLYEGDKPTEAYVIKSGAIKIHDIDSNGNEKILHIVDSPSIIPFATYFGKPASLNWYYVTLTDCELYVVPRNKLHDSMKADTSLSLFMLDAFTNDVHELLTRMSSLEKTTTKDKLLASLKFLVQRHARRRRSGWWRVKFSVNHQLLADMSGITRESTSMAMKKFQNSGIIRNPRLTILEINKEALFSD